MTTTLAGLSNALVYSAIAVYALALLGYSAHTAYGATRRPQPDRAVALPVPTSAPPASPPTDGQVAVPERSRAAAIGTSLTVLAFLFHLAALVTRAVAGQRAPWGNMYEFVLASTLAAVGAYLALLSRKPAQAFGVWVVSLALLSLGLAVTVLYTPVDALVPVLNSYWLIIHVAAAIVSGGIFAVGTVATALFLVRSRAERRAGFSQAPLGRYAATLPRAKTLEQLAHAAHMFAFPIWTFAILAGAIWAENSWGRYWGWDPKETWAFVTWVLYAAHLHAQATAGWRGTRAAWFALLGFAAYLFNFFGVNLFVGGLHSYAGV